MLMCHSLQSAWNLMIDVYRCTRICLAWDPRTIAFACYELLCTHLHFQVQLSVQSICLLAQLTLRTVSCYMTPRSHNPDFQTFTAHQYLRADPACGRTHMARICDQVSQLAIGCGERWVYQKCTRCALSPLSPPRGSAVNRNAVPLSL